MTTETEAQARERRERAAVAHDREADWTETGTRARRVFVRGMEAEAQRYAPLVVAAQAWKRWYQRKHDDEAAMGTGDFSDAEPCGCEPCVLYRALAALEAAP